MSTDYKPFSAGYIWAGTVHAKSCDCNKCAKKRSQDMVSRIYTLQREPLQYEAGKTVFVRAHLRRQPNHLNKAPRTYQYLSKQLQKTYG